MIVSRKLPPNNSGRSLTWRCAMKARLLKITIAIRTLLDVSKMSVVDLIKRLKEAEEAF
jgi:hypothetical protein